MHQHMANYRGVKLGEAASREPGQAGNRKSSCQEMAV